MSLFVRVVLYDMRMTSSRPLPPRRALHVPVPGTGMILSVPDGTGSLLRLRSSYYLSRKKVIGTNSSDGAHRYNSR